MVTCHERLLVLKLPGERKRHAIVSPSQTQSEKNEENKQHSGVSLPSTQQNKKVYTLNERGSKQRGRKEQHEVGKNGPVVG